MEYHENGDCKKTSHINYKKKTMIYSEHALKCIKRVSFPKDLDQFRESYKMYIIHAINTTSGESCLVHTDSLEDSIREKYDMLAICEYDIPEKYEMFMRYILSIKSFRGFICAEVYNYVGKFIKRFIEKNMESIYEKVNGIVENDRGSIHINIEFLPLDEYFLKCVHASMPIDVIKEIQTIEEIRSDRLYICRYNNTEHIYSGYDLYHMFYDLNVWYIYEIKTIPFCIYIYENSSTTTINIQSFEELLPCIKNYKEIYYKNVYHNKY